MKTLSLFAAILFSMFSINTATAQTVSTETIKVWGNCGMCKTTIEKAAKKAGAKTADWNEDSKELKVTYAVKKTSSAKIQEAIAKSGYDTQDFTAIQTAYDNLHGCCKYDRKADAPKIAEPASAAVYTCPMHADVKSDKPGKCDKCGMDMKEKMKQAVAFSCPMKCEGDKTYDKPGQCAKCGMDLKKQ
ncbi:MAG: heavy metal-binding domain-containing protein [Ferruginibacter sp.]